jgi:hypothetical protein
MEGTLLWRDWSRREHRHACLQLVRAQHLEISNASDLPDQHCCTPASAILSRAQRAHFRLSWAERLARNARVPDKEPVTIKLFGVPDHFAGFLGLQTV